MRPVISLPKILRNVHPRYAKKFYTSEDVCNPGYENITADPVCRLKTNDVRIWLLRSDGILITGVKNTNDKFEQAFDEQNISHIPRVRDDEILRYGHPTLAISHEGYDGGVLYAGWVVQRKDHLVVIPYSGRYYRSDLSVEQVIALSMYISSSFVDAYGEQAVIFISPSESNVKDYILGNDERSLALYERQCILYKMNNMSSRDAKLYISEDWLLSVRSYINKRDVASLFRWDNTNENTNNNSIIPLTFYMREAVVGKISDLYGFGYVPNHSENKETVRTADHLMPWICGTKECMKSRVDTSIVNENTLIVLVMTILTRLNNRDQKGLGEIFACMKNVTWLDLKGNEIGAENSRFQASSIRCLHQDVEVIDLRDNAWSGNSLGLLQDILINLPASTRYVILDDPACELLDGTPYKKFVDLTKGGDVLQIYINNSDVPKLCKATKGKKTVIVRSFESSVALFVPPKSQSSATKTKVCNLSNKGLSSRKDKDILCQLETSSGSDVLVISNNLLGRKGRESLIKIAKAIPESVYKVDLSNNAWDGLSGVGKLLTIFQAMPDSVKEVIIPDKELYNGRTIAQIITLKSAKEDFETKRRHHRLKPQ